MRLKTRGFSLITLLALTQLLTACFSQASPAPTVPSLETQTTAVAHVPVEQVTISFACWDYSLAVYEELAQEFQQSNPGIEVQFVSIDEVLDTVPDYEKQPEEVWKRLAAAADTMDYQVSKSITRQGLVRDLTPFIESDRNFQPEDFHPNALQSLQWDEGTWGLPVGLDLNLIFYNKDIFDAAGVAYPHIGWNRDDFLEKALALTTLEGGTTTQYGFVDQWGIGLAVFVFGDTAPLVDHTVEPPMPLLDRPAVEEVVRWYTDLALTYGVMPNVTEVNQEDLSALISDGRVAMWNTFSASRRYREKSFNLGIAPIPADGAGNTLMTIFSLQMSAGTALPRESWRWLDFLSRQLSPRCDDCLPARHSVAEEINYWKRLDEEAAEVYRHSLEHAYYINIAMEEVGGPLTAASDAILQGKQPVEEALEVAQQRAQSALASIAAQVPSTPAPVVVATPELSPDERTAIEFSFVSDPSPYRALADAFYETHPAIAVVLKQRDPSSALSLRDMAGTSDCFRWVPHLDEQSRRNLLSLQPFLEADPDFPADDFYPQFLEAFRRQGSLWGLPASAPVPVIYYDRDLLEETGVPHPQPGWTLDDFLATALALTEGQGDEKQYGFVPFEEDEVLLHFVQQFGAAPINGDTAPPSPDFDNPVVIEAVRWYADLSRVHEVKPVFPVGLASGPASRPQRQALIDSGRAAMWTNPRGTDTFSSLVPPVEVPYGIAPLPLGQGQISLFRMEGYFISADTASPQACWEWLKFLSDELGSGQGVPARRSLAESAEFRHQVDEEAAAATYRYSLEHGDSSIFRLKMDNPWLSICLSWFYEAFDAIMDGDDEALALGEAQRKAEMFIQCLGEDIISGDEAHYRECAQEVDPGYVSPWE